MSFAATWMDLEIIILSEVSKTEKDKYHMRSLTWNLKKGTYIIEIDVELTKQKQTQRF